MRLFNLLWGKDAIMSVMLYALCWLFLRLSHVYFDLKEMVGGSGNDLGGDKLYYGLVLDKVLGLRNF